MDWREYRTRIRNRLNEMYDQAKQAEAASLEGPNYVDAHRHQTTASVVFRINEELDRIAPNAEREKG